MITFPDGERNGSVFCRRQRQRPGPRVDRMSQNPPENDSQNKAKLEGRDGYAVGYGKPPREHMFKPGEGGRKRGSRNRLGEDFITALADDFAKHGAAAIERVRQEKPSATISKWSRAFCPGM